MDTVKVQGLPLKSDSIFSRQFYPLGHLNWMSLKGSFTCMFCQK